MLGAKLSKDGSIAERFALTAECAAGFVSSPRPKATSASAADWWCHSPGSSKATPSQFYLMLQYKF